MPKQKLILILGTALALIVAILVKAWMDQQRGIIQEEIEKQAATQKERMMTILFAKKEIAAGSTVAAEDVEEKSVPERQVMPQSVASLDRIQGMVAIADILAGEPLTVIKLAYPKGASGLAAATPVGRRAITIAVDAIYAVAGMIKPGDYVDVSVIINVPVQTPEGKQMTEPRVIPLFQNVEILAVGQKTIDATRTSSRYASSEKPEEAGSSKQGPLITLSLTPKEAGLLAYISEQGKVRLMLRNPSDSRMEQLEIADLPALFRYLSPQPEVKDVPPPKPVAYIDVYRGLIKDKVPIRE